MGIFKRDSGPAGTEHANKFRRKIGRVSKRDLPDLLEGHIGELSNAVLVMRAGAEDQYDNALWEAQRCAEEIQVILEELEAIA